jgi:hypothetical protein
MGDAEIRGIRVLSVQEHERRHPLETARAAVPFPDEFQKKHS